MRYAPISIWQPGMVCLVKEVDGSRTLIEVAGEDYWFPSPELFFQKVDSIALNKNIDIDSII